MSAPQLITEIAFEDPTASPTWVGMTDRVRLARGFRIMRGRQTELERYMPGRAVCFLNNRDLELDPNNTASAYYPDVVPERRIRHGLALNILTENQSSLETDTTGWGNGTNASLARSTAQALHGVASMAVTAVANGSTMNVANPGGVSGIPIIPGQVMTAMAWSRPASTARDFRVFIQFYDAAGTFLDQGVSPTVTQTGGAWTRCLVTTTAPDGAVYARLILQVLNVLAGEVHYWDQAGMFYGEQTEWCLGNPDGNGPIWAFRGFVDGFRNEYPVGGDIVTHTPATDFFKPMAHHPIVGPWVSYMRESVTPDIWYRLGESSGDTLAADATGNDRHGTYENDLPADAAAGLVTGDSDGAMDIRNDVVRWMNWDDATRLTGTESFAIGFAYKVTGAGGSQAFYLVAQTDAATGPTVDGTNSDVVCLFLGDGGGFDIIFRTYDAAGTVTQISSGFRADSGGDEVHTVVLTRNGSTGVHQIHLDGTLVANATTTVRSLSGTRRLRTRGLGYDASGTNALTVVTVDEQFLVRGRAIGATEAAEIHDYLTNPWGGDTAGERIARLLDQMAVPADERDVDTGTSALLVADQLASIRGLEHAQVVERSDAGRLYSTRDGRIRYVARHNFWTEAAFITSQATFSNDGADDSIPYTALRLDPSDLAIRNVVRGQRRDGPVYVVEDATSKARFFPRDLDRTALELSDHAEVVGAADAALARYKDPVEIIRTLRVRPSTLAQWRAILVLDLGYRVTIEHTPEGAGYTITQTSHLEGVEISNENGVWEVILSVSPVGIEDYWILGTSALGTETRLGW